jgi:hypothetical protein
MILINSDGIAIVSKKIQLPKVWDAIQKNYYYDSYQTRLKNAIKIKRWWRRASGFHDFKLIEPLKKYNLPPILCRQTHTCEPTISYKEIPFYREQGINSTRNVNILTNYNSDDFILCHKQTNMIMELKLRNGWVCKSTPKRFNKPSFSPLLNKEQIYKLAKNPRTINRNKYKKICCCNDPKAFDYMRVYSNTQIIRIFIELAKDNMNVRTRMKLSNFLTQRLSN